MNNNKIDLSIIEKEIEYFIESIKHSDEPYHKSCARFISKFEVSDDKHACGKIMFIEQKLGITGPKGKPLLCLNCGSTKSIDKNKDYLDGHMLLEYDTACLDCDSILAHWAYGHYTV